MPLSEQQMLVVNHPPTQHAVVLAVAGSGKSTTMVERIGYLIEGFRFDPAHIIAVMFNDSAAKEMTGKLQRRCGKRNAPESVTFHRLGTLTTKRLVQGGFMESWELIADVNMANRFAAESIASACKEHGHRYPRLVARDFLGFVDRVKSDLLPPAEVWRKGQWPARYDWFVHWFHQFENDRRSKKVRLFSDLIYDPVQVLLNNPAAAKYIESRYAHIILDEYQDISESQQVLIRFNAGVSAVVMAVGDDDQTIYGWRGAKASYILRDFHNDFPGGKIYKLNKTWRYGHVISCAANYVISGNDDRAEKLCISGEKAPQTKLNLEYEVVNGEPRIIQVINRWIKQGGQLSDIAILVRAYSHSADTQFYLLERGIPFRLEGGGDEASVLANKWVASLIGWMQLAAGQIAEHPYSGEPDAGSIKEIQKIINVPNLLLGWERTWNLAKLILQHPEGGEGFSRFISDHIDSQYQSAIDRLARRSKLWSKLRLIGKSGKFPRPDALLDELMYFLDIKNRIESEVDKPEEADQILELIEAFRAYVKLNAKGRTLPQLMDHIRDLLTVSERSQKDTTAIQILSLHRSKGMEYPCVIMPSLSQGKFPIVPRSLPEWQIIEHLADERRLFYVGMTRCIKELNLIAPRDPKLDPWLRACKGGNCDDVIPFSKDPGRASQFLYESNLLLSQALPAILAGSKGRETLKASSPELLNQYLRELGHGFQVPKIHHKELPA